MPSTIRTTKYSNTQEWIFQIVLHVLVFIIYTVEKGQPTIESYKIAFFLHYAVAAFIINYVLLPRFYYRNKTLLFLIFLVMTVLAVIVFEEILFEPIFFEGQRSQQFGGILRTLSEILPPISILSAAKFAWDALKKQNRVDDLEVEVRKSELQYLKSQINPHFLFNNLNNLYAYAIEQSPKTPEIILELSGVLRYMLYECKEAYVSLDKEIKHLENFINLSEMQIEERGKVNFTVENTQKAYQIAPLILIVFVENAFKYSTASQSEDISIDVNLRLTDTGELHFECVNSFQPHSNTESLSHGIGLENVKKRLKLLYPNAYSLDIKNSDNRYKVNLKIALEKAQDISSMNIENA